MATPSPQVEDRSKNEDNTSQIIQPTTWRDRTRREAKYQKMMDVAGRIRRACLLNNLAPWTIVAPYLAYEALITHSSYMRTWLADQPRKEPQRRIAEKSPQTFPYQSLEGKYGIRLVELLPGDLEEPISCSIAHHDLQGSLKYFAVSYSWVAGSSSQRVACGEHELVVQSTIFDLLKRLRRKDAAITLWIDAICINQADLHERSRQVEIMGTIYMNATEVIVWVGEEDERTSRLARFIDRTLADIEAGNHDEGRLPWALAPEWNDLTLFLDRPWFTRTWILQEVCWAKSCVLHCGSYQWPWPALEQVFEHILDSLTTDTTGVEKRIMRGVIEFHRAWKNSEVMEKFDLARLLDASKGTLATLPVDKVYAILPLVADRLGIQVDYTKSVQDVFKDTAARLIQQELHLEVLGMASDNLWNEIPGLPSWVPDWTCNEKPTGLDTALVADFRSLSHGLKGEMEAAALPKVSPDGALLHISMLQVDSVKVTGVPWIGDRHGKSIATPDLDIVDFGGLGLRRLEEWHSLLTRFGSSAERIYEPTGETHTAAFMRTIIANMVRRPASCSTWEEVYSAFKDRLKQIRQRGLPGFHSELMDKKDNMADYHDVAKTVWYKRTFFMTKNGHMGMGPFLMLPIDRIFVVPGLYPPLIMRRTMKGRYRLIGECYLHGWSRPEDIGRLARVETIQ